MIVPIRCKSCGKPIGHLYEDFISRTKKEDVKDVLNDLKVERFCCRAALMGHIELIDVASKFKRS